MASVKFTVNISISAAPLTVAADPVNVTGQVGSPVNASLGSNVNGGTPPVNFAVTGGSLPAGLALDAQGNLTGTPTSPGTTTVEVTATDAGA